MSNNDSPGSTSSSSQNGNLEEEEMRSPTATLAALSEEKDDNLAESNTGTLNENCKKKCESNSETKSRQYSDDNDDDDDDESDDGSSQLRPKTVTIKSTDEHKQRLVDIGAVSCDADNNIIINNNDKNTQSQPKSSSLPSKPKSENCYICGKDFLLSSLKVHEKQCAKKQAKEIEKQSILDAQNAKKSAAKPGNNFVSKIPRKLKMETCYLCGKEFFAHSLGVHETQCIKNWKADKTPDANETSVGQKTKCPKLNKNSDENITPTSKVCSDQLDQQAMDRAAVESSSPKVMKASPKMEKKLATDQAKEKVLKTMPCSLCGVQLLTHSLKYHEKKCRGKMVEEESDNKSSSRNKVDESELNENETQQGNVKIAKKPRTVVCYICGQEFLKSSYTLHEKQCSSRNKTTSEQEADKAEQSESKPVRKNDTTSESSTTRKPKTQKCFLCGKEMLLSSLRVHEQQCQKKQEILKNINQQNSPSQKPSQSKSPRKTGAKPKTEVCYVCGEAFLSSSIKVHEVQCEKKSNASRKMKT